jgi:hypothetical protein
MLSACSRDAPPPAPTENRTETPPPVSAPISPSVSTADILPLDQVRKSQPGAVAQRVATTEITITYSRPVARGRELFGQLVPFDQVWHPGADRASAIAFSRDVHINERPLAAGKYSLWTIPREQGDWTMIFSRKGDVFHHPYPGEADDALRIDVTPQPGPHVETLTFEFPVVDGKDAILRLHWGTVIVPMSIRVQ